MMLPVPHRLLASLLFIAVAAWSFAAGAAEVEGIRFDDRLRTEYGGHELLLNGAGVRTKFIFNVYAIGLYLPQKVSVGREALRLTGAKRVAITILIGEVSAEQFMTAIREKLDFTHGTPEGEAIRRGIEHISEIIDNMKLLKRGNTMNLDYVPGHGTRVVINGELRGQPIAGRAFFDALLDGWVGEYPVSESLKRALLGQET